MPNFRALDAMLCAKYLNSLKTSLVVLYSENHAAGMGKYYDRSSDCFKYPPKHPYT